MIRALFAVVLGYLAWSVLWLVGNAFLFGDVTEELQAGEPFTDTGPLAGALVLSVLCSVLAGFTAARVARRRAGGAVWTTALLLLATGIAVQLGSWSLLPLWYHLVFLVLLVPVTVGAGRAGTPRPRD